MAYKRESAYIYTAPSKIEFAVEGITISTDREMRAVCIKQGDDDVYINSTDLKKLSKILEDIAAVIELKQSVEV